MAEPKRSHPVGARLSENEIVRRLITADDSQRIVITPLIDPQIQIGSASVDLRLGNEFIVTEQSHFTHIDPATTQDEAMSSLGGRVRRIVKSDASEPFVLHPGRFTLGATFEFVSLPGDVAAHVEGRSTWARLGIQVHSTATNVHPWSSGVITFELQNVGSVPVELYAGMRIAQLVFFQLDRPVLKPINRKNKYHLDLRVASSRHGRDREVLAIRHLKEDRKKNPVGLLNRLGAG